MRDAVLLLLIRYRDGLCLGEAPRLALPMFLCRLRGAKREGCVILRRVNGYCRLPTSQVGSIASGRVVQVVHKDGRDWNSVVVDFFRQGLRRVGTIVREGIVPHVLRVGHVGLDLHFAGDGFRLANLRRLIEVVEARPRDRASICGVFARPRDGACDSLFNFFVSCKMVIRQAYRPQGEEVRAIAVLYTSRLLWGGDRLLLICRVTNYLRVHLTISRGGEDVRPFCNVTRRARRLVFVVWVEGRVDEVCPDGELVVEVFRRAKEASNCEQFRRVGRDGRVFRRAIKRLNAGGDFRCHIVVHVARYCLV